MARRLSIITEGNLERGRGPLFRRMGLLPRLAQHFALTLYCLNEPDADFETLASRVGVPLHRVDCRFSGWNVTNSAEVVFEITSGVAAGGDELVVLDWEIWDLIVGFGRAFHQGGARFATIMHAVPLLNCPANPSGNFLIDATRRIMVERDESIRNFIAKEMWAYREVIGRTTVIAANETVSWYFNLYFPDIFVELASPSYALDLATIDAAKALKVRTEFVFLGKLVREKGAFELLEIFALIRAQAPTTRLRLIGSFDNDMDAHEFDAECDRLGIGESVLKEGWLSGTTKYSALKASQVMLYPARESDTFSIAMLEALACNVPVVCWDLPFSRMVYRTAPVTRIRQWCQEEFASASIAALLGASGQGRDFAQFYSNWSAAADAEAAVFERLCAHNNHLR